MKKILRRQIIQDFFEMKDECGFNLLLQTTITASLSWSNLTGKPPVTQSAAFDEVKLDLSEATLTKPKDNLTTGERKEHKNKSQKSK